jgi:hypothetical protein
MSNIKIAYPATSSVALTISLASLASDSNLLAGRESDAVSNNSNNDLDHLLSGKVRTGAVAPTAGTQIQVWVYAPLSVASGTPTYPDVFDGTDSAETVTSERVKASMLALAWSTEVDATTARDYFMPPTSIAALFGGSMPRFWGVFVTQATGQALDATGGSHVFNYERIQRQVV